MEYLVTAYIRLRARIYVPDVESPEEAHKIARDNIFEEWEDSMTAVQDVSITTVLPVGGKI